MIDVLVECICGHEIPVKVPEMPFEFSGDLYRFVDGEIGKRYQCPACDKSWNTVKTQMEYVDSEPHHVTMLLPTDNAKRLLQERLRREDD